MRAGVTHFMNSPATLQNLQDLLHVIYEGNTDTPAVASDDWNQRTQLLNLMIRTWERTDGYLWPELMVFNHSGGSSDGATLTFTLPADFSSLLGYISVKDTNNASTQYKVVSPAQSENYLVSPVETVAWLTGTPGAYSLIFSIAPPSGTLVYSYLKHATELSAAADVTECPDPDFLVYDAVAELFKADTNYGAANDAAAKAEDRLNRLKALSMALPNFQPNTLYEGGAGFGQ